MSLPAIREKIFQLPRSRKILFLVFLVVFFIVVMEGVYYILILKNKNQELKIEKRGIYTYVTSEEGEKERFISGTIRHMETADDSTSLEVELEGFDEILKLHLPSDIMIYSWANNGTVVRRAERSDLRMGLKILISSILEKDNKEIEAKGITILE